MLKFFGAVLVLGLSLASVAFASDPVAAGSVAALTYRDGYVLFQLTSSGVNSCAPCPADPAGLGSGAYCWISTSLSAQIAMLLEAQAEGLAVGGRVNGISSDCTVYQMTVQNP